MPVPTLTTLAPEILRNIFKHLSPFHSISTLEWLEDDEDSEVKQEALCSISKTCQRLRLVVEPFLFKHISRDNYRVFCGRAFDDPSVFQRVKSLNTTSFFGFDYYKTSLFKRELSKLGLNSATYAEFESTRLATSAELMLAVATNIECLQFEMDFGDEEPTNSFLEQWFAKLAPVPGLPNLRSLEICGDLIRNGVCCWNPAQAVLIGAAPNLERLRLAYQNYTCEMGSEMPLLETAAEVNRHLDGIATGLGNLRRLEFTEVALLNEELYINYFRWFLEKCHKLETLVFRASGSAFLDIRVGYEPEPSPAQLLDTFLPLSGTLKDLEFLLKDHWQVETGGLIRRDQLLQFTQLRKLSLHEKCFCRKFIEPQPEDVDMEMGLVDILPPFIEILTITCGMEETGLGDVEALIAKVDRFPALREVWTEIDDRPYGTSVHDGRLWFKKE